LAQAVTHVGGVSDALPIVGLRVPSADIQTQVVEAPLVEDPDGALSWLVPRFVAGHAESTANAGGSGNAVLFGHVTSQTLGNVFENLHRARRGDVVEVYSPREIFTYQIVDVRSVPRTDSSVVESADTPTITLITCTGLWNPVLHDYVERLVVRAEIVGWASASHATP
jgi:LPXTG-site transpeptidase (sortase) family protein